MIASSIQRSTSGSASTKRLPRTSICVCAVDAASNVASPPCFFSLWPCRTAGLRRLAVAGTLRPLLQPELAVHLIERAREQVRLSRRHPRRARTALGSFGGAPLELRGEAAQRVGELRVGSFGELAPLALQRLRAAARVVFERPQVRPLALELLPLARRANPLLRDVRQRVLVVALLVRQQCFGARDHLAVESHAARERERERLPRRTDV